MIKLSHLSFQYPQTSQLVLSDLSFDIAPGTLTLISGASGSGKSTLLRTINGLVPHFSGGLISGNIEVFGSDPIADGPVNMAEKVGFVFQEPEAQFVFDIVENEIAFVLENLSTPVNKMHGMVDEIIDQLQIDHIRHKNINDISGGEKQKVAIASVLVSRPQVLILDEPTSQLDPRSAENILKTIAFLKSKLGLTVLISEHRIERVLPYVDFMLHLSSDTTYIFGEPDKVLHQIEPTPPIITIAKRLNLSPLPLTIDQFPPIDTPSINGSQISSSTLKATSEYPVLEIEQLSTELGNQIILKKVAFNLSKGEIVMLIGPNGSGKTTVLRSILGLIPSKGSRLLFQKHMNGMDQQDIIKKIGYLPQNPNDLLFAETVIDEIQTTLSNHKITQNHTKLEAFLAQFGLYEKKNQYPRDLSVGERQRTALAAITVHKPEIILMDEPTRGLDYLAKSALSTLLIEWKKSGTAVLLVTHDVEFAALIADRVLILENGEIKFNGDPRTAFSKFTPFQTQTSKLFPMSNWIVPDDVHFQ